MSSRYRPTFGERKNIENSFIWLNENGKYSLRSLANFVNGNVAIISQEGLYEDIGLSEENIEKFCKLREQKFFGGSKVIIPDTYSFDNITKKIDVMSFSKGNKSKRHHRTSFEDLAKVDTPYNKKLESLRKYRVGCTCVRNTIKTKSRPYYHIRKGLGDQRKHDDTIVPRIEHDHCSHIEASWTWMCRHRGVEGFGVSGLTDKAIDAIKFVVESEVNEGIKRRNKNNPRPDYKLNGLYFNLQMELFSEMGVDPIVQNC
jgi:hypothetical protein